MAGRYGFDCDHDFQDHVGHKVSASSWTPCVIFLGDRQEARRHASVLVLAELARHANVIVYPHVGTIINNIWGAMREPKVWNY
jgi:hypothetical protein